MTLTAEEMRRIRAKRSIPCRMGDHKACRRQPGACSCPHHEIVKPVTKERA